MTKQSPFAIFLVVLASQACAGSPIHTGNQAVGDASDATLVRPAADSTGIPDVASVPDRAAAQDLPPDLKARICGTGRIDPGEECDDGNTRSGDGCSATCRIECGDGPCNREFCGDGKLAWNDECDDGNFTDGDGCSGYCKVEPGFRCALPGRTCVWTTDHA